MDSWVFGVEETHRWGPEHPFTIGQAVRDLDELLAGEPIGIQHGAGGWRACSLSGEVRAHADTLPELIHTLVAQLRQRKPRPSRLVA